MKTSKPASSIGKALQKRIGLILICLAVVSLSYYALFDHYRNFRFDGQGDLVYAVESKLLDLRLRLRGPLRAAPRVGILAIDEKSIQEFGRWPFSRRYYAQAFAHLKELGVGWIGFDSIFSEEERAEQRDFLPLFESMAADPRRPNIEAQLRRQTEIMASSPADRSFHDGIAAFGNVVMGYLYFQSEQEARDGMSRRQEAFPELATMASSEILADIPKGSSLRDYRDIVHAHGILGNTPGLTRATQHFGFFSNEADQDAVNRWITLVADIDGRVMPSLSLKLAAEALNREIFTVFDRFGVESVVLAARDDPADIIDVPIDARGAGRLLLNPIGPSRSFRHFSLADAYYNRFTAAEKKQLKGMVLLLGGTASGINDVRPNAFDATIDGVENHAAAVENILTRNFLKRPASIYKTELLIVLCVGLLFAPLMIFGRALISGLAVVIFLGAYVYLDRYLWFGAGTWTFMAIPVIEIIGMFILTTLYKYLTEEAERKKLKGAFEHYLSPDVIDQMLEHPEALQLGGVKLDLTVLFSDVRGFTTISEVLSPERLCEFMNDYFTPMTSLILGSRGVLDKYIGDAIMAFWGAPIPLGNNADAAAQVAIGMLYALDQVQADFAAKNFPKIDIGIGLNSGPMSVGNMGSTERFTYTVMGDAVNLASRLEGLTKDYGIKIMISEHTRRQLTAGKFATREIDDIRVKGKMDAVRVYELMRPDFLGGGRQLAEFISTFEEGRGFYRSREWEKAIEAFDKCLEWQNFDGPSQLYIERCRTYLSHPPDADWTGIYSFTHK